MIELLTLLGKITYEWLPQAIKLGFVAPGTESAVNFLFSEVGEVLSELENLNGTWARRQDVDDDEAVRQRKLVKELCDVVMMCWLAEPEINFDDILPMPDMPYQNMAIDAGYSAGYPRYSSIYVPRVLFYAVTILQDIVADVPATYRRVLAERTNMLEVKQLKKKAQGKFSRLADRAKLTVERYHQLENKVMDGEELIGDEIVIAYLWDELSKRHGEYVEMANRKAVVVPDGECYDVIELYGQEVDKNVLVESALKDAGFTGTYPDDVAKWLMHTKEN